MKIASHCRTSLLLLALLFTSKVALVGASLPWLSHYAFDSDARDAFGNSPPMFLHGTLVTNGTLLIPENPEFEYGASARVSGLSFNSFTLGLDFNPHVLDFYPHSTILSGGTFGRWFEIRNDADGHLILTLNNSSLRFAFTNVLQINQWHTIFCSVDVPSQRIVTYLDSERLPDIVLEDFQFDVVGFPDQDSYKDLSFWSGGNASHFSGLADNLRVFGRALTPEEIESLASLRPTIYRQPHSAVAARADNVILSVDVRSSEAISYQWYKNGSLIRGAVGQELLLRNVRPSMAGFYTVTASNALGIVQSDIAFLAVFQPVRIARQPSRKRVHEGESLVLRVRATGSYPLTYQWYKNGETIPDATTPTLAIPSATMGDSGDYTVTVANVLGAVNSRAAVVVVSGQ